MGFRSHGKLRSWFLLQVAFCFMIIFLDCRSYMRNDCNFDFACCVECDFNPQFFCLISLHLVLTFRSECVDLMCLFKVQKGDAVIFDPAVRNGIVRSLALRV